MTARAQGIILQLVYGKRRTSSASASPFPPALSVPCRASAGTNPTGTVPLFSPAQCANRLRTHAGPASFSQGARARASDPSRQRRLPGKRGVPCRCRHVPFVRMGWVRRCSPSKSAGGSDSPACAQASAFNTHIVHGVADCARKPSAQPHACTHACTPRAGLGRARLTAWPAVIAVDGYRVFQPFEGGYTFFLLQAFSWLFLGIMLQVFALLAQLKPLLAMGLVFSTLFAPVCPF
jgi:hypothetical protein